jgi:tRNA pseudouridine55 synthase
MTAVPAAERTPAARRDVDGIVLLDKPIGLTSNQALQRVKRLFRAGKAGHSGSLDPLASGMLPICLGQATKVSSFVLDSDKVYRVRLSIGSRTTTGDTEGPVVETGPARISEADLRRALAGFQGDVQQVPPMYSALKHEGRRLYELARSGKEVERAARTIFIYELEIEAFEPERPVLRVRCSKGTYIRSLVEDIGRAAGTVAHVAELRRLSVTPFPEAGMRTLDAIQAAAEIGETALHELLRPPDEALCGLPRLHLTAQEAQQVRHGKRLTEAGGRAAPGLVRLYDGPERFLGVGECLPDRTVVSRRLLADSGTAGKGNHGL